MDKIHKAILIRFFFVFNLILFPCFSLADEFRTFTISFLGQKIGSLKLNETTISGRKSILISGEILSSPFEIFNGRFEYKTIIDTQNNGLSRLKYKSSVNTIFKTREINFFVKNDKLIDVTVSPPNEQTEFSNPGSIVFKFIDPSTFFMKILHFPCSKPFIIYDGRRIVDITPLEAEPEFECRYLYKIVNGPGHLSPFNFKNFEIFSFSEKSDKGVALTAIVKAGPFKLIFNEDR